MAGGHPRAQRTSQALARKAPRRRLSSTGRHSSLTRHCNTRETLKKSGEGISGGCRGGIAEFTCFRGRFPEPSGLPFRSNGTFVGFDRPGRWPVSALGPTARGSPGQLTLRRQQVAQAQQRRQGGVDVEVQEGALDGLAAEVGGGCQGALACSSQRSCRRRCSDSL